MELKVDLPALAGQNIDPDTFQRVWDRVMPDCPSGDQAAPAVPDLAVPAQPSAPPEEFSRAEPVSGLSPVPNCPAAPGVPDCPAAPGVPDCPAAPGVPDCPAAPGVPDCPVAPGVPDCPGAVQCPACPACPACPILPRTQSAPETAPLCLGEASQGDSGQLEALMTLAREGAMAGRLLARRANGACARALSALTQDHRLAFRRLSAAYFLITGKRYAPTCTAPSLPSSLPLALRQQFVWEQQWEQQARQAAQATADPCLKELYLELAQEGAFHAGTIRSLLEQM